MLMNLQHYKKYNNAVCKNGKDEPAHTVIEDYIKKNGKDYRYEISEHPVEALRDRKCDNIEVGRR